MNNDKLTELAALEAKATPGPWERSRTHGIWHGNTCYVARCHWNDENNAALIVAMRNALPELLKYAKAGSEPCEDCSDLGLRLQDTEEFADAVLKILRHFFADVEPGDCGEYYPESFADAIRETLKERDAALARAEKAEAERDVLVKAITGRCGAEYYACPPPFIGSKGQPCPYPDSDTRQCEKC